MFHLLPLFFVHILCCGWLHCYFLLYEILSKIVILQNTFFCFSCSFWMKLEIVSALCLQVVLLYFCVNSYHCGLFFELKLADMRCVELLTQLHLRLQYTSF